MKTDRQMCYYWVTPQMPASAGDRIRPEPSSSELPAGGPHGGRTSVCCLPRITLQEVGLLFCSQINSLANIFKVLSTEMKPSFKVILKF